MPLKPTDLLRGVAVAVTAVSQLLSSPVSSALQGGANTGAISDANLSPVTPAGYAFSIWGLIYLASLALAVYQLLPSQRHREVHRRTGWWIAGAFTASTVWVPIFGTGTIWLSQIVILMLVACLAMVTIRLTRSGAAGSTAERWLLRLPVTLYLGWATLATFAGFGATFRSLGMPERSGRVTLLALVAVLVALVLAARRSRRAGVVLFG